MLVRQLKLGPMANFVYLLADERTREAAVVDPGFEAGRILAEAGSLDLVVTHVLLTHGHGDHVAAVPEIVRATGARVVAHPASPVRPDVPVGHGDVVSVGSLAVRVHHTPGHQPDAVCFEVDGHVLTGDTLFVGECGRTDLPGSDPRAMWRSLLRVLAALPRDLVVLPGHDYGPTPTSTLGREFAENYTLNPRTEAEFVRFMAEP